MRTDLFDVVISTACNTETHELAFTVRIFDRYSDGPHVPVCIGASPEFSELDDALKWAGEEVRAFMTDAGLTCRTPDVP